MANFCKLLQCLPSSGGLLDQDPLLLKGMYAVYAAQEERAEMEANREKARARK